MTHIVGFVFLSAIVMGKSAKYLVRQMVYDSYREVCLLRVVQKNVDIHDHLRQVLLQYYGCVTIF